MNTPESIAAARPEAIQMAFSGPLTTEQIGLLCKTMRENRVDPGLRAIVGILDRRQEAAVTEILISQFPTAGPGDREKMANAIKKAIRGYTQGFEDFIRILLRHGDQPGISGLAADLCRKLRFSHELMEIMVSEGPLLQEWVGFMADYRSRGELEPPVSYEPPDYQRLDALLAAAGFRPNTPSPAEGEDKN